MEKASDSFSVNTEALGAFLPFSFCVNEAGSILSATPSVSRLIAPVGKNFFDQVLIETPNFAGLGSKEFKPNTLLVFTSKLKGIRVRGTFTPASSGAYFFVGALSLKSAEDVIQYGLTLADFTSFDAVFDNLLLLQVQKKSISELKEAQSSLIEERSRSIQNAKLASLGEMSAGIAHEINNPLAIIQANASLLLRHFNDPVKLTEKIESIKKSCTRISKIISGLKKFSRSGESVPYQATSLSVLANEALLLIDNYAKENAVSMQPEINSNAAILCNEIEIEQVFINLIRNAIDAVKDLPEKWVKLSVFDDGEFAVVRVLDSGKGVPEAIREKLFQPFFTTKPVGKGTGLGLSITKGILDEHKAAISVDTSNSNTCFEIRFLKSQNLTNHLS